MSKHFSDKEWHHFLRVPQGTDRQYQSLIYYDFCTIQALVRTYISGRLQVEKTPGGVDEIREVMKKPEAGTDAADVEMLEVSILGCHRLGQTQLEGSCGTWAALGRWHGRPCCTVCSPCWDLQQYQDIITRACLSSWVSSCSSISNWHKLVRK